MDTVLVMDIAVGVIFLISAIAKGAKGLYKYITPLLVVVAAIVGAMILSNVLTPVIAEAVYPKVEDRVVEKMQENREDLQQDASVSDDKDVLGGKVKELLPESLLKLGEKLGQLEDVFSSATEKVGESTSGLFTDGQKDKLQGIGVNIDGARDTIYAAAFDAAYRLTEVAVRWTLRILGFVLLYLIFTLLKNALHFTVKLPVIGWVDKIGGAALGIVECVVVLLIVGMLLKFFNIMLLHDLSEGTKIAAFFFR